ncbi:MAG: hypothetical protein LBR65_08090 [Culturomica sp.]|jgi:hypothetical protein|nr:hypothetical protein [Culturomica sp.]
MQQLQRILLKSIYKLHKILHSFIAVSRKEIVPCNTLLVIYRISDAGYKKEKPDFITNENCLRNAVGQFPPETCLWYVIADNVSEDTFRMIQKYIPNENIERVSVGHGAGTFRLAYEHALSYPDHQRVYFLENDYLHKENALTVLHEGFSLGVADYLTLYDHPDKYGYHSPNFLLNNGRGGGENSALFVRLRTLEKNKFHYHDNGGNSKDFA